MAVTRAQTILFLVLAASGVVFLGAGTSAAIDQRNALARVHSVPAKVVGLDVEEHHPNGNHAVTYRPVVRFEYRLDSTTFIGDQVGPLREARGGHWAWRVLDRYEVGQRVTAWVRYDVPGQAYLERAPSPQPYYEIMFGVLFTASMCWLAMRRGVRAASPT